MAPPIKQDRRPTPGKKEGGRIAESGRVVLPFHHERNMKKGGQTGKKWRARVNAPELGQVRRGGQKLCSASSTSRSIAEEARGKKERDPSTSPPS